MSKQNTQTGQIASNDLRQLQQRMVNRLLLNLLLALLVPLFFAPWGGVWEFVIALVVFAVILGLIDRRYGHYLFWSLAFVGYLIWQILLSNLALAWLVIQPKPKLNPAIIAIPLTINTGVEIIAFASAITLTPGTLSLDLARNAQGERVLYVHTLQMDDPEKFRADLKNGFERTILRISRGVSQ